MLLAKATAFSAVALVAAVTWIRPTHSLTEGISAGAHEAESMNVVDLTTPPSACAPLRDADVGSLRSRDQGRVRPGEAWEPRCPKLPPWVSSPAL